MEEDDDDDDDDDAFLSGNMAGSSEANEKVRATLASLGCRTEPDTPSPGTSSDYFYARVSGNRKRSSSDRPRDKIKGRRDKISRNAAVTLFLIDRPTSIAGINQTSSLFVLDETRLKIKYRKKLGRIRIITLFSIKDVNRDLFPVSKGFLSDIENIHVDESEKDDVKQFFNRFLRRNILRESKD